MASIAQRILNRHLAHLLHLPLLIHSPQVLVREVDAAVLDLPVPLLREIDDGALAIEEEEVLGRADGEGGVGGFGTGGDFVADLDGEDLALR